MRSDVTLLMVNSQYQIVMKEHSFDMHLFILHIDPYFCIYVQFMYVHVFVNMYKKLAENIARAIYDS